MKWVNSMNTVSVDIRKWELHPWSSFHHRVRSYKQADVDRYEWKNPWLTVCSASTRAASCIYILCTPVAARLSWLSLPVKDINAKQERTSKTNLLMEDRLGLTTITRLLSIVTTLSLRKEGVLALLVLRHLMRPVAYLISEMIDQREPSQQHTCASCRSYPCNLRACLWVVAPSYRVTKLTRSASSEEENQQIDQRHWINLTWECWPFLPTTTKAFPWLCIDGNGSTGNCRNMSV